MRDCPFKVLVFSWVEDKRLCLKEDKEVCLVTSFVIPTRCRCLHLKQICLEDVAPAVLIILITHIVIAVRWMLIKILSVVINGQRSHKVIVPDGYRLYVDIIA